MPVYMHAHSDIFVLSRGGGGQEICVLIVGRYHKLGVLFFFWGGGGYVWDFCFFPFLPPSLFSDDCEKDYMVPGKRVHVCHRGTRSTRQTGVNWGRLDACAKAVLTEGLAE